MKNIHIIPALEDNYFYAITSGSSAILIDCGDAEPVIAFLQLNRLTPTDLLCTHHHDDHVAGIAGLQKAFPEIKIHVPESDISRIPGFQDGLHDQQTLDINGFSLQCIETPGHTKNHLCFYLPPLNAIFTGDALFSLGCGRLFEGDAEDLFDSMQKLKNLPGETMIYFGHEYTLTNVEFSLSVEPNNTRLMEKRNQVLKLRQQNFPTVPVSMAEEKENNLFLKAPSVEKIAQLRQLRDKF